MTTMTRETSIKCGNCGARHGSAADVKNCYQTSRMPGRRSGEWAANQAGNPYKMHAVSVPARPTIPDVKAGHYAVPSLTGNNDLDFFRVDRPETGRWAGRTFVHRVIGGQSDSPVRGATAKAALAAIAKEPEAAGNRYADELGRCRDCNRHLTDEESRLARRGPICRNK